MNESPARGRPTWWGELVIGSVLFGIYLAVDHLGVAHRTAEAERNGRDLLDAERVLRIPVEEWFNDWLVRHPALQPAANYEYASTYVLSAAVLLIWLYRRRPATYRWARNSFVLMNLIAMTCFVAYPVTPPRLLPGEAFVDTVLHRRTWGSWGSPLVQQANQLAAMPSLHIGWAVWVSIVLACISSARWLQVISAGHVLLTAAVVMATANHYVLDVVAGVLLVLLTVLLMGVAVDRPGSALPPRLAAPDAFFLYVETAAWPQHVGGLVVLDDPEPATYRARLHQRIQAHLGELPRFRQTLTSKGKWHRARWADATEIDWDWHTPEHDLRRPDGRPAGWDALTSYVAALQSTPLPRDRPLWRFITVTGFADDRIAAILLVHHAVADGIGTISQAFRLMDPQPPTPAVSAGPLPWWRRAVAVMVGLAQLATDGAARDKLPSSDDPSRWFGTFRVPLAEMQAVARAAHVRVTDVLLSMVAGAVSGTVTPGAVSGTVTPAPSGLRVSTTLMVRAPDSAAEGNATAAVMLTVPLSAGSDSERLAEIGRRSRNTQRATRALASRFVMSTVAAVLPPAVHAWFARTVYGHRFLQAIISNMPGPVGSYRMAGGRMVEVYPILPLAPRAPLALAAVGWDGTLFISLTVGPDLVEAGPIVAEAARGVLASLVAQARVEASDAVSGAGAARP